MKYSQITGVGLCILLIIFSFVPWVYIPSIDKHISGMFTEGTNFGKPAVINIFFTVISLVLFLIPKLWAKRINLFMVALNLAWTIRNFFVVSSCFAGECPEKQIGLYGLIITSVGILIMATLPKIATK